MEQKLVNISLMFLFCVCVCFCFFLRFLSNSLHGQNSLEKDLLSQQERSNKLKKQLEEIEEGKRTEAARIEQMKAELEQVGFVFDFLLILFQIFPGFYSLLFTFVTKQLQWHTLIS